MSPDDHAEAAAARIAADLRDTLRHHHSGGELTMDIPTSGIARALADLIDVRTIPEAGTP